MRNADAKEQAVGGAVTLWVVVAVLVRVAVVVAVTVGGGGMVVVAVGVAVVVVGALKGPHCKTEGHLMLVLTRKIGQKIIIGGEIEVMVVSIRDHAVRLGIDAPSGVAVNRKEIEDAENQTN